MTKQEFLAFSLPYGVKAIDKFDCIWTIHPYKDALDTLRDNEHLSYENFIKEDGHKLILRPLSDLTKEIEHKGEKFVPMDRIAIYNPNNLCYFIECILTGMVEWIVVTKLIEWHFDIADLISKGEAIDVNTLDVNPYK